MRFPRAVPLAVFLLIAGITVLSIFAIENGEKQRHDAQLRAKAGAVASALELRANTASAYLQAGAALLAGRSDVRPERLARFVRALPRGEDRQSGSGGIGWAPFLVPAQIPDFEKRISEQTGREFTVDPLPEFDDAYVVPVTYLEPDDGRNRRARGFDMASDPVRRKAMQLALSREAPTATEKVVLKQEGASDAPGFLIYMPVFADTRSSERLKGFIYSPLNADAFLRSVLVMEDAQDYSIQLYDGKPGDSNLLASSGEIIINPGRPVTLQVVIANNPWTLQVSEVGDMGISGLSMATLIFGLLTASLLMLLVRMLTQQALEDEASLMWFEEQASIRNSLTRELNHRVKNTLANVLSIIALTRRRATSLGDFADGLDGRIRALSATHDLLTNSDWGTTPVRAVIEAELVPYSQGTDHFVDLRGPHVELAPNDALSLGLAVHELATNAAKYGALSKTGGKVTVYWKLVTDTKVRIEWLERGGPPVVAERGRGFGTDLIERIVAHELRNPVRLDFEPEGVRCVLTIPVRRPTEFQMRATRPALADDVPSMQENS